jgi:L-cysteine/cystine lyase
MADEEKLAAVRAALPALDAGIYLNTGSVGPLPAETAAAMAELAAWELRTGRAHVDYVHDLYERMSEARAGAAAVLHADVDAIALTHSTTDGMNHAAWSIDWRPGDRAVTTRLEHPGGVGALYALRERAGIEVIFADVGSGGDDAVTLAALDEAIVPGTRLVALSHVAWGTGAVLPIAEIAKLAHDRGALVAVDGAQSAGAIPIDLGALGVDFYAISAQKWLLGPEGMGALAVSPAAVSAARPAFAGWFSFETVDAAGRAAFWPDARRFEGTGFHRPSVLGMARSLGWLSMYVGLDWVHARAGAVARRAAERLAAIPGVELITPLHQMATLVSFRIAGWPAERALDELGARVFAIARHLAALDALRISVGFFTTDAEIERFAGAVELLAAHTPETIPPKRGLTVIGQDA